MGAFDANGDGLSDVAFSFDSSFDPGIRAFAAAGSHSQRVTEPMMLDGADARLAIAFAAGDYNGDGLDDVAIATPLNDTTRICIWLGDRDKLLIKGPCVVAPAGDTDFGVEPHRRGSRGRRRRRAPRHREDRRRRRHPRRSHRRQRRCDRRSDRRTRVSASASPRSGRAAPGRPAGPRSPGTAAASQSSRATTSRPPSRRPQASFEASAAASAERPVPVRRFSGGVGCSPESG